MNADATLGLILGIISLIALVLLLLSIMGRKLSQGLCVPSKSSKSLSMANLNHRTIASTPKTTNETYSTDLNRVYEDASSKYESSRYQSNHNANEFVEEFFTENFKQESSVAQHEKVNLISKFSTATTNFYSNSYIN